MTRIGIVDDHPAILLGTATLLNAQPDLQVVASSHTVVGLLHARVPIDVVLLDLVLGDGTSPTSNLERLRAVRAPVIAYTAGDRPQLVREAGRAGAAGMLRKSQPLDEIVAAIRAVAAGEVAAGADWASALDADPELPDANLTERERQVLGLYASGETAESVAGLLYISRDTVIDHIRRIRAKYAAVDRAAPTKVDLYRRAMEDGTTTPRS